MILFTNATAPVGIKELKGALTIYIGGYGPCLTPEQAMEFIESNDCHVLFMKNGSLTNNRKSGTYWIQLDKATPKSIWYTTTR
jgi:hypothetical protein